MLSAKQWWMNLVYPTAVCTQSCELINVFHSHLQPLSKLLFDVAASPASKAALRLLIEINGVQRRLKPLSLQQYILFTCLPFMCLLVIPISILNFSKIDYYFAYPKFLLCNVFSS